MELTPQKHFLILSQKQKAYLEAVIRTPSYLAAINEALAVWQGERQEFFQNSYEATMLKHRFGLPYLIDPERPRPEIAVYNKYVKKTWQQQCPYREESLPLSSNFRPMSEDEDESTPAPKMTHNRLLQLEEFSNDGRYLLVQIDLDGSDDKITAEIRGVLKRARLFRTRQKKTRSSSNKNLTHYDVWDEHKKGKSLFQIASEMLGITPFKPNDDVSANAAYKKIKRLYEKADKAINGMEKSFLVTK